MLCVQTSNRKRSFVNENLEGHCLSHKSADTVISMFYNEKENNLWSNKELEDICVPSFLKHSPWFIKCIVTSWCKNDITYSLKWNFVTFYVKKLLKISI